MSARSERQSRTALLASWVVIVVQFTLFLLIGVLLWVYYRDGLGTPPARTDQIYPAFVWHHLPTGLAGLIVAAILAAAMANLSAALNALASTTIVDIWRGGARDEAARVRLARWATVGWGAVLLGIGIVAGRLSHSVLEAGLTIGSIPAGALLGVFLLGVLTRRPGEVAAMAGVAAGLTTIVLVIWRTPHRLYLVRPDRNGGHLPGRMGHLLVRNARSGKCRESIAHP